MRNNTTAFSNPKLIILIVFFCISMLSAQENSAAKSGEKPLSDRLANYKIEVNLNTEKHLLEGTETLTWRNNTNHRTKELQFHLYYNAWYNQNSSMIQKGRRRRGGWKLSKYDENDWAYTRILKMEILNAKDKPIANLTDSMSFIQPDDGNPEDRTVLRAGLPSAVRAGKNIRVRIQWEAKIPRTFARTGVRGNYYFISQWFPKIGVFEADGTWNCHQFISTEFFADFGVYDVKMTVPTSWVLGATGVEMEKTDNENGTTTHYYHQADVHDFAWVTTPEYQSFTETFQVAGLPMVKMRLLLMPAHLDKRERYFDGMRAALKYYGTWWGPYPYDHITIVDPAYGSGAGGMEYPTFFTGGVSWISPKATRSPEGVTVHEGGHQFWYGIVANNEFEDAWMDEGFDTYSTTRTMEQAFPNPVLTRRYFERFFALVFPDIRVNERTASSAYQGGFYSSFKRDQMSVPSWQYGSGAYGVNSYTKGANMLRTLENYLGWETFQKIMSTYFQRWKFKHPKPDDFFAIVNEISGQDLGWFFEQTFYSSNIFDYAVASVSSKPKKTPKGYQEIDGEMVFHDGGNPIGESYASEVEIRRWGEAIFPIKVKVTFSDGAEITESWDGKDRWKVFTYSKNAKITRVEVDPEQILVLDVNPVNNTWVKQSEAGSSARKWASKWMVWLQNVMEFFAFLA